MHGVPKDQRKLTATQQEKAASDLDRHQIDKKDGQ
jgi:hypothetical protein